MKTCITIWSVIATYYSKLHDDKIEPKIFISNLIKVIESNDHDSCITWIAGNGTILLQNIVRHNEECVKSRVIFWSNFINMYYQGSGSSVNCCQGDGCNRGLGQNFRPWQNENTNQQRLHLQFPGASDLSELEAASNIFHKITIYLSIYNITQSNLHTSSFIFLLMF